MRKQAYFQTYEKACVAREFILNTLKRTGTYCVTIQDSERGRPECRGPRGGFVLIWWA